MFALLLISGGAKFGLLVFSHLAAVAVGYAFRGKEHAALAAAGAGAKTVAGDVAKKL